MERDFVHLRVHTEFSISDGLLKIKPLMEAIPKRGMQAVAVTDWCNLFAVVKVFKEAEKMGIKPIIGCDLLCHSDDAPHIAAPLVFLCQNEVGYKNLTQLVSRAWQDGQAHGSPRIALSWLTECSDGLIVLSGGCEGRIGKALVSGNEEEAYQFARYLSELFPDRFYLEIQRIGRSEEALYHQKVLVLAKELKLPPVATNDVRFMDPHDFEAHEARVCIHGGVTLDSPTRERHYRREQYLRSREEMVELFSDIPEAIENTVHISKRCTVMLKLGENYLPNFPLPKDSNLQDWLCLQAKKGLEARFSELLLETTKISKDIYEERLQLELNVINGMGFGGYFLIVADFIQWAREHGIPVGPGRGSGAGSLVAYALRITDLDPLQYDLLFERFLNPERVSMPDFDIDFCMEGRDRVIEYVTEKYGRENVSQIITFGTMAAKAVVRDVGRVLGHPYGFVDKIAKLVPFELGITLAKALEEVPELYRRYQDEEEVKELLTLAMKLEGLTRNAGKHAGGVVIAPSKLTDFTAIYCESGSKQIVSQLDKDDVEAVGLVKFDFLGLRTLTIVDKALSMIAQNGKKLSIAHIPMNDKKTFDLLKSGKTTAIFQLESRGMKELISRLKPDCFEDIIALVALFRPGPLQSGMVDDFINRKHGLQRVEYPHAHLEPILKPTYGVILYQEQVMQIAQVLGGYTLGAADLLRRAMGKKKPEEMARQRTIFLEGAERQGVSPSVSSHIFDLMEKFAGYGFNKSHSAAYALVSYQTAWLKAHYPSEFMAAVMSSDMDNTDKMVIFLNECRKMNLKVISPSIHLSQHAFTVTKDGSIIYGLGAIKGVGSSAIGNLIKEREEGGVYLNLFECVARLDLRKVNRRVLEALIKSGAMDEWNIERSTLIESLEKAMKMAEFSQKNETVGQANFFSLMDESSDETYVNAPKWTSNVRLNFEKETLGLYLTGHPVDEFLEEFQSHIVPIASLVPKKSKRVFVFGLIVAFRRILTKRGKMFHVLTLQDATETIEVLLFPETPGMQHVIPYTCIFAEGEVSLNELNGETKMNGFMLYSVSDFRIKLKGILMLSLDSGDLLPSLQEILSKHRGSVPVQMIWTNQKAKATLQLSKQWSVVPSDILMSELSHVLGKENVWMKYEGADNIGTLGECRKERV